MGLQLLVGPESFESYLHPGVDVPEHGIMCPEGWSPGWCYWHIWHRITKSSRLGKTSKIIKSNRQPITTMPAKLCPEVS